MSFESRLFVVLMRNSSALVCQITSDHVQWPRFRVFEVPRIKSANLRVLFLIPEEFYFVSLGSDGCQILKTKSESIFVGLIRM